MFGSNVEPWELSQIPGLLKPTKRAGSCAPPVMWGDRLGRNSGGVAARLLVAGLGDRLRPESDRMGLHPLCRCPALARHRRRVKCRVDLRRHRCRGRHPIAMAACCRPCRSRAQGSVAAPKPVRCEHQVVAPRSRLVVDWVPPQLFASRCGGSSAPQLGRGCRRGRLVDGQPAAVTTLRASRWGPSLSRPAFNPRVVLHSGLLSRLLGSGLFRSCQRAGWRPAPAAQALEENTHTPHAASVPPTYGSA
jgi:hypothetical protein